MNLPQPSQIPVSGNEVVQRTRQFVRRRESKTRNASDTTSQSSIIVLAVIGLLALVNRRIAYDSWMVLSVEFCLGFGLICLMLTARKRGLSPITTAILGTAIVAMPWIINQFSRNYGHGNDAAMLMLTNLGWGGAVLAVSSKEPRTQNLSAVCSGFLTLFAVFTADSPEITLVVYLWMAVCLWWLANRHWIGVSTMHATNVQSSLLARMLAIVVGCSAFVIPVLLISDSVPLIRKLRAEIAPTSGGTSQKDKSARRGVGNGDALIAAQNHATSFGPVETDFFLDSPKPSLFDVFSEEFGEPIRKKTIERAQALSPNDIRSAEGEFSEANRNGGGEFSIEREAPKVQEPLEDLKSDALMFFEGRSGIRLAVERYDSFTDNYWKKSKLRDEATLRNSQPESVTVDEDLWFAPDGVRVQGPLSPFVSSLPEALRFTHYGDNSIPAAAGTQLWRIDEVTRTDFFAYTKDHCLLMPGRETVPDYTVVRFINSQLDAEKLQQHLHTCAPGISHLKADDTCRSSIARLAHKYGEPHERGLQQVQSIVDGVKREFTIAAKPEIDGAEKGALDSFLENRKGPRYMFATTAALMLDHFGYKVRLVTGFYVNPRHYVSSDNATAILPRDAHCWIEVNSGHGHWVPFEPTPGYRTPPIRSTWMFWISQNWQRVIYGLGIGAIAITCLFLLRGLVFNAVMLASAPFFICLPQRWRLRSLRQLLDVRWAMIGARRPASITPRRRLTDQQWGLSDTQQAIAMQFFDTYEADRFGARGPCSTFQPILAEMPGIIRSVKKRSRTRENQAVATTH